MPSPFSPPSPSGVLRRVAPLVGVALRDAGVITNVDVEHARRRAYLDVPAARAAFAATATTEGTDGPIPDSET